MFFNSGTDACFYNAGVIRDMKANPLKSCGGKDECSRCGWNPEVSARRIEEIRRKLKASSARRRDIRQDRQ